MILPAVTSSSVEEDNVLVSLTSLLVENFASSPEWRLNINVTTDDGVLVQLRLVICRCWTGVGIVKKLKHAAPDMCPVSEGILSRC